MRDFIAAFSGFLLIQIAAGLIWVAAYRIQKTSIIDIFWSLFVLAAAVFYFVVLQPQPRVSSFYLSLITFWALRLASHIYLRGRGHGEDARYRALRFKWGAHEKKKMLIFFFQQGCAAWVFSLPFLILFSRPIGVFSLWQAVGTLIWIIAFNGEAIADAQLRNFKNNPANQGKVCRMGLWRYSRHPNYFFEWLNWVAFAWLALPHEGGWIASFCPVLMYHFLNQVSGVPLNEKQALQSRPQEYAEYQKITPPFFPWFPKKRSD